MNKKTKKYLIIIGGAIALIAIIILLIKFFFATNNPITFKEKYLEIEYGKTIALKDTIESIDDKNAKIIFPDIELKEVGNYDLIFVIEENGKKIEQEQTFVVKDTKLPKIDLKITETLEVNQNSTYDIFNNVKEYKNLSDIAINDKVKVDDKTYKETKKQIEKQEEVIANREIKSKKDIKSSNIKSNYIMYTTDYDATKEGTYSFKVLAVDENYHSDEVSFKVKVVPAGQLVNSGGVVSCVFNKENLQSSKAYETNYTEWYSYDQNLLVNKLDFITEMKFSEDYNTAENMQSLVDAINKKYGDYIKEKGISVEVSTTNDSVITKIGVDFDVYSVVEDHLNLLESKKEGKVKVKSVIDKLKDKAVCEIK